MRRETNRERVEQSLSKMERDHERDRLDVAEMLARRLVEKSRLLELFHAIEPKLIRYPAIDPSAFRRRVLNVCQS